MRSPLTETTYPLSISIALGCNDTMHSRMQFVTKRGVTMQLFLGVCLLFSDYSPKPEGTYYSQIIPGIICQSLPTGYPHPPPHTPTHTPTPVLKMHRITFFTDDRCLPLRSFQSVGLGRATVSCLALIEGFRMRAHKLSHFRNPQISPMRNSDHFGIFTLRADLNKSVW